MPKRAWLFVGLGLLFVLVGCGTAGGMRQGEPAPDFTLEDLQGNQVRLSDFAGQPVLINFWNTWCPPCRAEMPDLQEIYASPAEERSDLVILAVNLFHQEDDQADVEDFVQELGLTFPVLLDEGQVAVDYRVGALPTSVFVDAEGRVHLVQVGPISKSFVRSVLRDLP